MPRKGTLAIVIPNNPAILGYAAGLLDGEGSIWISKTMRKPYARNCSYEARVVIHNTSEPLMTWLVATFGCGLVITRPATDRKKTAYEWRIQGHNMDSFLEAVMPYLIIKRERAGVAIQLRALQRRTVRKEGDPLMAAAKENLKVRLNVLNARGVSPAI